MKKIFLVVILVSGFSFFATSCANCKTCKKTNQPTVQICKDEGTDQEYNDALDFYTNWLGYSCQ